MRLTPVSRSDLIKRLRALGWQGPIAGRKHQHMIKNNLQLTIPNPHRGDRGVNLLKIVLNEAVSPTRNGLGGGKSWPLSLFQSRETSTASER